MKEKDGNGDKKTSSLGGSFGKGALALALLAVVMGLTNPVREEYLSYASEKLATELKTSFCKESQMRDFLGTVGSSLAGACKALVTSQRDGMERFIDNSTTRQNLLLFSIYTTELSGKNYRTIGAFGNFLTFPAQSVDKS